MRLPSGCCDRTTPAPTAAVAVAVAPPSTPATSPLSRPWGALDGSSIVSIDGGSGLAASPSPPPPLAVRPPPLLPCAAAAGGGVRPGGVDTDLTAAVAGAALPSPPRPSMGEEEGSSSLRRLCGEEPPPFIFFIFGFRTFTGDRRSESGAACLNGRTSQDVAHARTVTAVQLKSQLQSHTHSQTTRNNKEARYTVLDGIPLVKEGNRPEPNQPLSHHVSIYVTIFCGAARACNCHIRLGLLSRSPPLYLNLALQ